MQEKPNLKIDWASYDAAKYACTHWHYSKSVPMPPIVKVGVWEDCKFIGVVLFSRGASPQLGAAYNLSQTECCELTRVALTKHKTTVSRIIAIAIKFLKKNNSGLKLIVSFADKDKGHHGGIYQAGGWIYSGESAEKHDYLAPNGKRYLSRQVAESGFVKQFGKTTKVYKRSECLAIAVPGKHRYLMPLNDEMKTQVAKLSKPYPKRVKQAMVDSLDTAAVHHRPTRSNANPSI
jgi:hypothetical protein